MAEYIRREDALDCLKRYPTGKYAGENLYCAEIRAAADDINDLPSADVAPVVHGCWVSVNESQITGFNPEFAGCDPAGDYICSRCGGESIFDCNDKFVLSKYCLKKKKKMDLER